MSKVHVEQGLKREISKRGRGNGVARTRVFLVLVLVPVVVLVVYYAPSLTALGWHVLHGRSIDYRGLHVTVPWGWTADLSLIKDDFPANPQGITLQKPPKTLNIESRGPELIYINLLLPDARSTPQQQAAEWESLFRQSHPKTQFDVSSPREFPESANCLQATPRARAGDAPQGAALACVSIAGGWVANYAGSQRNVDLFRDVIGRLKPQG
jgi:hypothetical protein